jgi:phosphoadenosine phosphosulfate reductase
MAIVKNDRVIEQEWITVDADGELPSSDENVIVPLARFKLERDSLLGRNGGLGVQLNPGDAPEDLADGLDRLSIIAVNFPAYTDGRGYSYGRVLRERMGYTGELRAVGDVLRDQILLMHRCGFDAYELKVEGEVALNKVRAALKEMTVYYQPTGDGRVTAQSLRERRRAALQ